MGSDLPGKVIGIFLAFVLCVIMPFVNVSTEQEMVNRRLIVEDISDFVDTIIDGRVITDAELKEFSAHMASYGMLLDYDITRFKRTVNPNPVHGNSYSVAYVEMDDNRNYDKGDKVVVHVYEVTSSTTSSLSHRMTGLFLREFDYTVTARIR